MILLTSLALTTVLTAGTPPVDGAPCRDANGATSGFSLALDGERASRSRTLTAALDCVLAEAADSSRSSSRIVPARSVSQRVLPEPATPGVLDDGPAWLRPFSFFVSSTGVYESNIDHDENPIQDYGAVFGVGTHFETDTVEIEYEVASHNYQNTDRWDRISHSLTSSYEQKITRKLSMEAVGELALRGSSEDRELGDQYVFEPRLHYRISPSNRLRLYGAYRLRRYDENPERDATNRYVGLELRQRLGTATLDVGYRTEQNHAEGPRFTYDRQTYSAQLSTPLAGGLHRLGLEVRYRPQQYANRFVRDRHPEEGLRRDRRWIFSLGGSFALGRSLELLPGYKFETRSSNDPDKKFGAHAVYVGLRYWFGKRGNPAIARRRPKAAPADAAKRKEKTKSGGGDAPPAERAAAESVGTAGARMTSAPPKTHESGLTRAAKEKWSERAEAERHRLLRGTAGNYTIDLGTLCGDRALEDAWRRDSASGALWLIPSARGECFQLYWGHFSSRRDADRALRKVPAYFRTGGGQPPVVAITSQAVASTSGTRFP